ncbi:MAG: hypothetical protein HY719_05890 [Planctomycetes bacterium]|nr:hypothetical protein [Planctomycetota bacterium]
MVTARDKSGKEEAGGPEAQGDRKSGRGPKFRVQFGDKGKEFTSDDLKEGIDALARRFKGAADFGRGLGQQITETLKGARGSVISVRVGDETRESLNLLVEVGLFQSISEAAAFLVAEGLKSRAEVVNRVREKADAIRNLRDEARGMIRKEMGIPDAEEGEPTKPRG